MSFLTNTIVKDSTSGFFLNSRFYGITVSVSKTSESTVRLYAINVPEPPMEIDLNTITILDVSGIDVTPVDNNEKAELLAAVTKLEGEVSLINNPTDPLSVNQDEILVSDIDWDSSDFTGWTGNPRDLFGNVNNGGIYNDSSDNPKVFILKLFRTKKMRDFGIGANVGSFSNVKTTLLGSGGAERGVLDASEDPYKFTSLAYAEEEFVLNAVRVEFFTTDRVDVSNLFFKYTYSPRKQLVVHKWGANADVDAGQSEFIWPLGDVYQFTDRDAPKRYYISSSNAGDGVAISVETVGVNTNGRFQREKTEVVLQGQTKVEIPTAFDCVACNRAFVVGDLPLSGNVYIYEDTAVTGGIPNDLSFTRAYMEQSRAQTRQAIYMVPEFLESGARVQQFDIYQYTIDLSRQQASSGEGILVVWEYGGVPRERHSVALSDSAPSGKIYGENTPLIIPAGSFIYLAVGEITANNTKVFGDFSGSLIPL